MNDKLQQTQEVLEATAKRIADTSVQIAQTEAQIAQTRELVADVRHRIASTRLRELVSRIVSATKIQINFRTVLETLRTQGVFDRGMVALDRDVSIRISVSGVDELLTPGRSSATEEKCLTDARKALDNLKSASGDYRILEFLTWFKNNVRHEHHHGVYPNTEAQYRHDVADLNPRLLYLSNSAADAIWKAAVYYGVAATD